MLLWLGIVLTLLFVVAFIFKMTKLFFKIFTLFFLMLFSAGVLLIIASVIEGSALKKDLADGPAMLFYEDGVVVSGAFLTDPVTYPDEAVVLGYDIASGDRVAGKRTLLVDIAILQRITEDDPRARADAYVEEMRSLIERRGQNVIVMEYMAGNIVFVPEPLSYKIVRTQPLIPMKSFFNNRIVRKVLDLDTT